MKNNSYKIVPFLKFTPVFLTISIIGVVLSLYLLSTQGLNYGVDFRGGVKLVYRFSEPIAEDQIRKAIEPLSLGDVQIVQFGKLEENSVLIKSRLEEGRDTSLEIGAKLKEIKPGVQVESLSEELVGPKVGAELRQRGLFAIVLTWVFMLIYIGWRFDFLFAPGAVLALLHDVLIGLGYFVWSGREFNLPILAAVLTLIGYSINDTIVIFDRIRENLRKLPATMPLKDLVDYSFTETLGRTIVTSLTVFFVMGVLFVFGGNVLNDFAAFMLVGVVAGTYSTMFIASPVYLLCAKLFPHKGLARGTKK